MTTPTHISMDEYLSTSYEPEVDYVDGTLEVRNVGEWDHSSIQFRVLQSLMAVGEGLFIRPALRVKASPTRCRVPDVAVYESNPNERVPTVPPLLVVEVLSPEDRMYRVVRKLRDFQSIGCKHIWVLNPEDKTAYHSDGESLIQARDQLMTPRFSIRVADIFSAQS